MGMTESDEPVGELTRIANRMLGVLEDYDPDIQAVVLLRLNGEGGIGAKGYEGGGEIAADLLYTVQALIEGRGGSVQIITVNPDLN